MAQTATRRGNGHSRRRSANARAKAAAKKPRRGAAEAKPTRKLADAGRKAAVAATKKSLLGHAARAALKTGGETAKRAARTAGEALQQAGARAQTEVAERLSAAREAASRLTPDTVALKRLPIQVSIDIAVPLPVAWQEWMALERLPEGVHAVTDIERDGDELTGRAGHTGSEWAAEVIDEREEQSFAWQSREGSDCAGLVTFHQLSERLTRLELNLDVVPTSVAEAALLATRIADRRAEAELRRLKARLELISPDQYEDND